MGWFKRYQDRVLVKPETTAAQKTSVMKQPAQKEQQHALKLKEQQADRKAQSDSATKHASLFGGYQETPFALTGARNHEQAIWKLSTQVYDVAPGYAIAEPDNPDNPDAVRVEALGLVVGYVPKAKCKRIKRMGDKVKVLVILDHYSSPTKVEIAVRGIF
jgi:hypothetical protein